jgi:hypothetical protein
MSLQRTVRKKHQTPLFRINGFKTGYQRRSKLVKDDNDDLLAESHNIFKRGIITSHIFNLHSFHYIRQI